MAIYSIVAPNSSSAEIYDREGGSLLAAVPTGNLTATVNLNVVSPAFAVLKDGDGNYQMSAPLYLGVNYLKPTLSIKLSGATAESVFPPAVHESMGLRALSGRIKHASGNSSATILHIASGFRPSVDTRGVAVLNGASISPISITALGDVTMTASSWTSLGLSGNW